MAFVSDFGPEPVSILLETARKRFGYPGEIPIHDGQADRAGVLIEGLLRTVVSLPDGRSATIHYSRPVAFFGLPTVFLPIPLSVHAVRKVTVFELDSHSLRRVAREHPEFGWLLSRHLAAAIGRVPSIIEEFAFRTVIQRVALHVIRLAESLEGSAERTAFVTHSALAEYVRSGREVVSRCLESLAADGLVALGHGRVRIIDEANLRDLSAGKIYGGRPISNDQSIVTVPGNSG